jgi:phosphoribosylglycinamide formyltransferase-1
LEKDSLQLTVDSLQNEMGQSEIRNHKSEIFIAIFASGAGSNAQAIIHYFKDHAFIKVALVFCNKPGAGVLDIARKENIPALLISREIFFSAHSCVPEMREKSIDFIVLAGFLWKIPQPIIAAYSRRVINIHPALLPKYGGKGMYSAHVHNAVLSAAEKESGITIHYVDEHYDNGDIIFQARCAINENDTPETLAQRIHGLEHQHFSKTIEQVISGAFSKKA